MSVLGVWMNGVFVGQWHQKGRTASRLVYDPSWVDHPQGRPLSLPMTGAGDGLRDAPVDNYFDNLLPDNEAIRHRIGARFKASSLDAFTLLQSIGRCFRADCCPDNRLTMFVRRIRRIAYRLEPSHYAFICMCIFPITP